MVVHWTDNTHTSTSDTHPTQTHTVYITSHIHLITMARTKLKKRMQQPKKTAAKEKVTCCICLSDTTKRKEASLDCCDHKFCKKCILKWSKTENTCPQCRKKFTKIIHGKREISVEERSQRSDSGEDFMTAHVRISPVLAYIHVQVSGMVNMIGINFESNRMLQPQSVPLSMQYTSIARINTLIWFGHNGMWRNQLMHMLKRSRDDNNAFGRGMTAAIHMLFNVINRFMTNASAVRTTNFTDMELGRWLQEAHRVVFGDIGSSKKPISLDDIPPARPEHRELSDEVCTSNHPHLVAIWSKVTGLSPSDIIANRELLPKF